MYPGPQQSMRSGLYGAKSRALSVSVGDAVGSTAGAPDVMRRFHMRCAARYAALHGDK